ncbi:MAG: Ig-like domain-containing protein [Candidatus Gracilibacteria bacterium]
MTISQNKTLNAFRLFVITLSLCGAFFIAGTHKANAATHYMDSSLTDAIGTIGLCDGTADHYDATTRACVAGAGVKGFSSFEWAVESTRVTHGDTVYVRGIFNDTANGSTSGTLYATVSIGTPSSSAYVTFDSYDADASGIIEDGERAEFQLNPGLSDRYFQSSANNANLKFKNMDFTNPGNSPDYLFRMNSTSTATLYFENCFFHGNNYVTTKTYILQTTTANVNITLDKCDIIDFERTFFYKDATSTGNVNFTLSRSFVSQVKRIYESIAGATGTTSVTLVFNDMIRPILSQILLANADTTLRMYNNRISTGPDVGTGLEARSTYVYTKNEIQILEVAQECFASGSCTADIKGNNFWTEAANWETDTFDTFFSQEYNYLWDYVDYTANIFTNPDWNFLFYDGYLEDYAAMSWSDVYNYGTTSYGNCRGYDDGTLNLFATYPTDKNGATWACASGHDIGALTNSITAPLALPTPVSGRLCLVGDSIGAYLAGDGSPEGDDFAIDHIYSVLGVDPFIGNTYPQDGGYPALGGLSLMGGPFMAWYNIINSRCDTIMLSLIVNDLSENKPVNATYQKYADTILELIDFYDTYASRLIWTGVPPESDGGADPVAHTIDPDAVQDLVEVGCTARGIRCGSWLDYLRSERPLDWATVYYDELLTIGSVHPNEATGLPKIAEYYTRLYDLTLPTSSASHDTGSYGAINVTLSCSDNNECNKTYYTTNGDVPTTSSTEYSSPIALSSSATTTIKFFSTDMAGNSGAVVTKVYTIDAVAPTVSTLSPLDGATAIAVDSNLVLTFPEAVAVGTGNIVIKNTADDTTFETIAIGSAQVTGTGTTTITINPTASFASSTGYYVQIATTAIDDLVGNSYAGIADTTTWNFTSADVIAPTVSTLSPLDGATAIAVDSNLVLTFSEAVAVGTGNIVIKKTVDNTTFETIAIGSAQVTGTGTTIITINPLLSLTNDTEIYVQIDATAIDDLSGNGYAGIADATTWNFATVALPVTSTVTGGVQVGGGGSGSNHSRGNSTASSSDSTSGDSVTADTTPAISFLDVAISYSNRGAIEFFYDEGIIQGYSDGTFKPEREINRAELLKILITENGDNPFQGEYKSCFTDVSNEWFAKYVCYAKEQGWVEGYADGTFRPGATVNMVEAFKMMVNAKGLNVTTQKSDGSIAWYLPYVELLESMGVIDQNNINNGDFMRRGEFCGIFFDVIQQAE